MTSKKTIKKTKLIRLISTFSVLEWKRFGRFVQSPYHNSNQTVIKFYTVLKKYYPFAAEDELEQEVLYKKVFGAVAFKTSKLQNLCSDLYGLAEDFLIDVYLQKEHRKRKKVLVDALAERNYELFTGESQKLIREVEKQEYFLDSDDFLLLHQLNEQYFHHIETEKFTVNQLELEKTQAYLEAFYEDATTQIAAENSSAQNILKTKKHFNTPQRNQVRNLYSDVSKLNQTQQLDFYFQYKEKILSNWDKLKPKHKTNLLVILLNFLFTNELVYKDLENSETFSLYKLAIQERLFIINGKMRDIEYINICMVSLKLKMVDWTIAFIKEHKQFLPIHIQEFLIPLAYAYVARFQGDYKTVISLLSKVNPTNNLLYLYKIKSLLIRAYFEEFTKGHLDYELSLTYEIESFKKWIKRDNKLSSIKNKANTNFIELTQKLLILFNSKPYDLIQIQEFETILINTSPLILRSWLEEKVVELKSAAS